MTPATRIILDILKGLAGTARTVKVSNPTLAEKAGVNTKTVSRAVGTLIQSGFLSRTHRPGNGQIPEYRINDVPVEPEPGTGKLSDGCDAPPSELHELTHGLLKVAHFSEVPYRMIDPRWNGEERCDYLLGYRLALEVGKPVQGRGYTAGREFKRAECRRLGIHLVEITSKKQLREFDVFAGARLWRSYKKHPKEDVEAFVRTMEVAYAGHGHLPGFIERCRQVVEFEGFLPDVRPRPGTVNDGRVLRDREHGSEQFVLNRPCPAPAPESNAHEDGSWNGIGEPTDKQMETDQRVIDLMDR